ncbi:2794_t:CDS:1 [Ambispora gerdemannii]|uniref:2794_t:CDS:1 n=1 Tax=Ambispora gerdemannii TaxID=144530 RepID=A0A9N9H4Q3_9GLOM|nr:2794_t:CDS:1 [Ambispora gerdemannii]
MSQKKGVYATNHRLNYLSSFSTVFHSNLYHFQQQHDASFPRTWDKQEYEQRARDRHAQQLEEEEERRCKGLKPKPADDVLDEEGPRDLLTARIEKVVLDANLNRTQLVQSTSIASK